jgi:hypothetical protein
LALEQALTNQLMTLEVIHRLAFTAALEGQRAVNPKS